jgi:rubrerythrin
MMDSSEAIKELQENIDLPFGSNISKETTNLAIQALERQIPKKPRKTDSYRGVLKRVYAYVCPTCGNVCLEKYMNERQNTMFCWNCGQKLDWGNENDD